MPGSVEHRLIEAADRAEIAEIMRTYAHGVDRKDVALVLSCFHPEGTFQFQDAPPVLATVFFEGAAGQADGLVSTTHHLSNEIIVFDGDGADTQVYLHAYHLVGADAPDRPPLFGARGREYGVVIGGRYLDRFERRDDGWKIARRTLYFDWHYIVDGPQIPLLPFAQRDGGFSAVLRARP